MAARPVGAASATDLPAASASVTSAATVRLLPVPGPPVSTRDPALQRGGDRRLLRVVEHRDLLAPGRVDRLGGGQQPRDALRDRVLGLDVAGEPEQPVVGLVHRRRLDRGVDRGLRVGRRRGRRSPSATSARGEQVWPSRACRASTQPTSARDAALVVAAHAGQGGAGHPVGLGRRHPEHGEQPPRVVAQQPRRGRAEQVHRPAGDPHVQPGRHDELGHLVGRGRRR